jgi:nicotinic acid mononucleotide adenylyltransferase
MTRFLVVGRTGFASAGGAPDLPPLSSSAVRDALARDDDVSGWVPRAVLDYVRAHGLYGAR